MTKNDIDIQDEDLNEEDFTPEELEAEDVDWKAKAQELKGIAKRRATQLAKVKAKLAEKPEKEQKPQDKFEISQPSEPDYAKIAYLNSLAITHPDDQKSVQDEALRLKLPLTDVLQMEHMKSRLDTNKTQREAMAGMPKGRGTAGGKTQADVDYWLANGKTPDDLELAKKVIDARVKGDSSQRMFDPLTDE